MCWEDPLILLESLKVSDTNNVLSIISGGENFFALLLQNPRKLVGIDINKEQIFLTKLKMCAIENLNFKDFVKFIGLTESSNRIQIFSKIKFIGYIREHNARLTIFPSILNN